MPKFWWPNVSARITWNPNHLGEVLITEEQEWRKYAKWGVIKVHLWKQKLRNIRMCSDSNLGTKEAERDHYTPSFTVSGLNLWRCFHLLGGLARTGKEGAWSLWPRCTSATKMGRHKLDTDFFATPKNHPGENRKSLFSDPLQFTETITKTGQYKTSSIRCCFRMGGKYTDHIKWHYFIPQEPRMANYSQEPGQTHCLFL